MDFDKRKLEITVASFDEATDLQDAIARALKGNKIDIPDSIDKELNISSLIDAALSVLADKEIREKLFVCAERALYDRNKVNKDFFEEEENRSLYQPIMIEIIKKNVGPFFKNLLSSFGLSGDLIKNILKQKSD
jgi:hypothetical protein